MKNFAVENNIIEHKFGYAVILLKSNNYAILSNSKIQNNTVKDNDASVIHFSSNQYL
jgi:hypothetical protein